MNNGQPLHIQYLDPLQLLQMRSKFQSRYTDDTFAIQFQIRLRGGFHVVDHLNLWKIIQLSLPYYDYSLEQIKSLASLDQATQLQVECTISHPANITCIPHPISKSLIGNFIYANSLRDEELFLMKQLKVVFVEEYICLRSILLTEHRKTDIQELLLQLDNTTKKSYAKLLMEMFMYYLIKFQFNIGIYSNLYDKPFEQLQNLKQYCQSISVAVIGCTLRNFVAVKILVAFGFQVTIFTNNFESENFYNPVIFSNKPNCYLSLLDKCQIEAKHQENIKYEFYTQNCKYVNIQNHQNCFFSILKEVLQFDEEDNFYEKFYLILDATSQALVNQSREQGKKKYNLVSFQQTNVGMQSFSKINYDQANKTLFEYAQFNIKASLDIKQYQIYHLQKSVISFFESSTFSRTKAKLTLLEGNKITCISYQDGQIQILMENQNILKYNYLVIMRQYIQIYGDNTQFINNIINNVNIKNIKNNPGFDAKILMKIQELYKDVKIENFIKIIMTFSNRFWSKKKIVCVQTQTNDYVFFIDASNDMNSNILIAIMNIKFEEYLKNQDTYNLSILATLSTVYNDSSIKTNLNAIEQCIPFDYFMPSTTSAPFIQPFQNLYLNVQLSNGSSSDQLNQVLEQTFKILSSIIETAYKQGSIQKKNSEIVQQPQPKLQPKPNNNIVEDLISSFFGLNHPLYLSSLSYSKQETFYLVEPYEYRQGNYMLSLGLTDHYSAIVTLPSLFSKKRVHYLFMMLKLREQILYCMVPEDDQTTLLVHSSYKILYEFCTTGQQLKTNIHYNPIEFNPMFMFPNIFPSLILREIQLKKSLTQIRYQIEFDDEATQQAINELYKDQVGSLFLGISHPILKVLIANNQNKTVPNFYEEFLQNPLFEGQFSLKASLSSNGNTLYIERKFLSPFCNGIHPITIYIKRDTREIIVRQPGEDDEVITKSLSDLWDEVYERYIELYPGKFVYRYFKELIALDKKIQEQYKPLNDLLNLMYKKVAYPKNLPKFETCVDSSGNQILLEQSNTDNLLAVNGKLFYSFSIQEQKKDKGKKNKIIII